MRTRMLVLILFMSIFFCPGFGATMSQHRQREMRETINGAELADGLPQADGTRRA